MGRNNLSIMKVIYKPQRIATRHKSNVSVPGISQAPASAFGRSLNSGNTNEKLKSPIYHSFNKRRFKVHISEKQKVRKNLFGSTDPDRDYHQSTYFPNSIKKIFKDKRNRRTLDDHSNSSSSLGSRTFQRMMSLKDMFLKPEIRRKRSLPVEKKGDDCDCQGQALPGPDFETLLREKSHDCEGTFDEETVWNTFGEFYPSKADD